MKIKSIVWRQLILLLGILTCSESRAIHSPICNKALTQMPSDGSANNWRSMALTAGLVTSPEAINRIVILDDPHYYYIIRGVAPREALTAIAVNQGSNSTREGRVHGFGQYGIQDEQVIPGFVLGSLNGSAITPNEIIRIFNHVVFYSGSGAALEAYNTHYHPDGENLMTNYRSARDLFPDERGFCLVYRVPRETPLEFHPESNVDGPIKPRVIALPQNAELYGVYRFNSDHLFFDQETGLPQHSDGEYVPYSIR